MSTEAFSHVDSAPLTPKKAVESYFDAKSVLEHTNAMVGTLQDQIQSQFQMLTPDEQREMVDAGSQDIVVEAIDRIGGTRKAIDATLKDATGMDLNGFRDQMWQNVRSGGDTVRDEVAAWMLDLGLSTETLMDPKETSSQQTNDFAFGSKTFTSDSLDGLGGGYRIGAIQRGQGAQSDIHFGTRSDLTDTVSISTDIKGRAMAGVATTGGDLRMAGLGVRAGAGVGYRSLDGDSATASVVYSREATLGALEGARDTTTVGVTGAYTAGDVSAHAEYLRKSEERNTMTQMTAGVDYQVDTQTALAVDYVREGGKNTDSQNIRAAIQRGFTEKLSGYIRAGQNTRGESSVGVGVKYNF